MAIGITKSVKWAEEPLPERYYGFWGFHVHRLTMAFCFVLIFIVGTAMATAVERGYGVDYMLFFGVMELSVISVLLGNYAEIPFLYIPWVYFLRYVITVIQIVCVGYYAYEVTVLYRKEKGNNLSEILKSSPLTVADILMAQLAILMLEALRQFGELANKDFQFLCSVLNRPLYTVDYFYVLRRNWNPANYP